ncbi:MAG: hypothetical protein FWE69_02735 [Clostridiales bacterium]|nr:hypothetical protein [Clostridiales bacterium]
MKRKQFCSFLLALLLLFCSCVPLQRVAEDWLRQPSVADCAGTDDWVFSDITFTMPDVDKLIRRAEILLRRVQSGRQPEKQRQAFEELCQAYESAHSACAYAYIRYCQDMREDVWQARYIALSGGLNELHYKLVDIAVALIAAEQAGALTLPWNKQYKQGFVNESTLGSPEVLGDMERELALVNAYDRLGTGRDDLDEGEFARQAGALFSELRDLRLGIAEKLGYESYAAYRYDCYRRDYSTEEITALCAAVKTFLVPLCREYTIRYAGELYNLYTAEFVQSFTMARLQTAIAQTVPALSPAWDYMMKHELYDLVWDDHKLGGSYTIYLSDRHAPFLYSHWDGSATVVGTVIHEFGHFSNSYFNPSAGLNAGECLDLCEVDSQGFELLMMGMYDTVFTRYAKAARVGALLDGLYSVVAGCMEDEFAQRVYAAGELTVPEVNDMYRELGFAYGLSELYGAEGTGWTYIPHHFQSPLYYISYATSMLAALRIWELAQQDRQAATTAYLNILNREPYSNFQEILAANGLGNPIDPAGVEQLAQVLKEYFESA